MHILKEVHLKKVTYYMIPTLWHSRKGKTMKTVKRSVDQLLSGIREVGGVNEQCTEDF